MSDGPHRSLTMRRGWTRLADRADNSAFAPEEIRDALLPALEQDWRAEVSEGQLRQIRHVFADEQGSLFDDDRIRQLETLKRNAAGYEFAGLVAECALQAASNGLVGDDALVEMATDALFDRASRGARQVEEHYYRKSAPDRALNVRARIENAIARLDVATLARQLVGVDPTRPRRTLVMQKGLDDGVQI